MSKNYVLNDMGFDNAPIHVIEPEEIVEEELRKSMEKNKKIIDKMRSDENYKKIMAM